MKISIIIPVLNEEEHISILISYLKKNSSSKNIAEIIVVDGGSTDGTFTVAEAENAVVISSKKGRAIQMNTGAKQATGEILYFLHADCLPPKNFDIEILQAIQNGHLAGCFRLKFDSNHWWLKLAGWFTRFNWSNCRGGDQSQFITKALFEDIGGYDESFLIYEDNILIKELYKRNRFTVLPKTITTSARLYKEKGIWTLQYHFWAIHLMKRLGATAKELYAYYAKNIKESETNSHTTSSQKNFADK
ncbi:MAG: glycosyl transferase family 2 [Bacteroidetes bacterium HGW-Bacteroidetes-2]|jgi:rSAM/selenodomain-associated transferase 2|nr:MAG: glycosyl transferase family 2 [Bacteroidetes bacterium HGW-Bacteroidetes-2]